MISADNELMLLNSNGNALATVLIAATIGGVLMLGLSQSLTSGFKGAKSTQIKGDLTSLRETLRQVVNCDKTFALGKAGGAVNPAADCASGTPVPLTLFDKNGNPITDPISSVAGTYNPLDSTFEGSGRIAQWHLRSYCDNAVGTLVIRAAKKGNSGSSFEQDPFTKRDLAWSNKPIFGESTSVLCAEKVPTAGGVPSGKTWTSLTLSNSPTFLSNTNIDVPFNQIIADELNEYDIPTRKFTAREAGIYSISALFTIDPIAWQNAEYCKIAVLISGVAKATNASFPTPSWNGCHTSVTLIQALAPGDTVSLLGGAARAAVTLMTVASSQVNSRLDIIRLR